MYFLIYACLTTNEFVLSVNSIISILLGVSYVYRYPLDSHSNSVYEDHVDEQLSQHLRNRVRRQATVNLLSRDQFREYGHGIMSNVS